MAIWNYIKEHDNGITNFHFEVAADLLNEEEMELIRLLFFEEYTVKKTAQYFGCCTKTIRNRKNKVLQKLKDRLETL